MYLPVLRVSYPDTVLIDTWWNVNFVSNACVSGYDTRFNRYMVECEFYLIGFQFPLRIVLIDTWWNVNLTLDDISFHRLASFNRYMVECEFQ